MIPKIIHYCWFGGNPLSPLAEKCIASWKKFCPDYEIIQWDESNYNVHKNKYMEQAYATKKWGFVPDYARLDIIYNNGGVYFDTDVELIKSIDDLLQQQAFAGCEKRGIVALGLGFGAEKGNNSILALREKYNGLNFVNEKGSLELTPAPIIQTSFLQQHGLKDISAIQRVLGLQIYPPEYFCPIDLENGKLTITPNTYSIHHYAASWESKTSILRGKIYRFLNRYLGKNIANFVKKIFGRRK